MQVNRPPQNAIHAAVVMLSPYVPELTAQGLVRALSTYEESKAMPLPSYISLRAAAESLGVSRDTVLRMIRAGNLEAVKVRGQWRVPAGALDPSCLHQQSA